MTDILYSQTKKTASIFFAVQIRIRSFSCRSSPVDSNVRFELLDKVEYSQNRILLRRFREPSDPRAESNFPGRGWRVHFIAGFGYPLHVQLYSNRLFSRDIETIGSSRSKYIILFRRVSYLLV